MLKRYPVECLNPGKVKKCSLNQAAYVKQAYKFVAFNNLKFRGSTIYFPISHRYNELGMDRNRFMIVLNDIMKAALLSNGYTCVLITNSI